MLAETSFEMSNSKWYMKDLPDCEKVSTRSTREFVKNDGFYRAPVREDTANKNGSGILYLMNVTEVF